jgi:hypothetical protein
MWKGEWKAYVFWWLGWPLLGLLLAALALCVVASKERAPDAGQAAQHQTK